MSRYDFRVQVNNTHGCLAGISLSTKLDTSKPKQLVINYKAGQPWENACKAGIHIFYDYYRKTCKLEVTIEEIHWLPIDTNYLIVMFATVKALASELNVTIPNLEFDKTNEVFIFPELRSLY